MEASEDEFSLIWMVLGLIVCLCVCVCVVGELVRVAILFFNKWRITKSKKSNRRIISPKINSLHLIFKILITDNFN